MLRNRHQLDMRIAHTFYIGNQLVGKLIVGKRVAVRISSPRADVKLIDIHRLAVMLFHRLMFHPRGIVPVIALNIIVFGGVARTRFKMIGIGVAFEGLFSVGADHTEFVRLILPHDKRQETLPDAVADLFHGIIPRLPVVEVPGYGNLFGIRRPNTADHAFFSVFFCFMYSQKFIGFYVGSLMEQIKRQIPVI